MGYNTDNRPLVLKKALDRCSEKGWLKQISGKGFSGTYRLMHPYYPSPRELWGSLFVEKKAKEETSTPKRKALKDQLLIQRVRRMRTLMMTIMKFCPLPRKGEPPLPGR